MNSLSHSFSVLLLLLLIIVVNCIEGLYFFYQQPEYPRDCTEVYAHCLSSNSSGVYTIKPDGYPKPFEVYCNNEFLPGGWTVINRQLDGSLTFNRTWEDFRNGFGFLSSEFYIGNDKLSYLTNQGVYELRIDMMLSNKSFFYIKYKTFRISDEYSQYALVNADEFSGNSSCVATSCPIEMVHESCTCQTSCSDPVGIIDCREVCVETCVPKGCLVSETNSFILEGEFYSDTGCTKMCSCSNGQLTCDNSYRCDVNAVCERRSDYHQCYCNAGFVGNGTSCQSICRPNEVYGTCTCQNSCANPTDCLSCTGGQGCFCPNGFYLQGEDCVRQQDCRCFIDGLIIPEGQSYSDSTCSERCSCNSGQRTCDNDYQCDVNAVCERRRSDYHKCYCNEGYSGDGVTCQSICRTNEVYGTCSCQKSCANPTGCVSCSGGQGCYCPNGFYLQGGDCVQQDQCGCYIDGTILLDGDTYVNSGCTRRCTCTSNRLNCDNNYRCSSHAACSVRNSVRQCYCNSGYEGDGRTCTRLYTDCNDVKNAGNTRSDVYSIRPAGYGSSFDVYCNMDIDGGGWTVFQRRTNGATSFYRNWASYKNGFGNSRQEFWLGNEKLYYLTQQATYEYRMDFVYSSRSYHHKYSRFRIDNESNKYRVTDVGSRSGTRGGSLDNGQNVAFSTYDRDNDGKSSSDCAEGHRSGWWHGGGYNSYSHHYCECYPEGSRHRVCSTGNPNGEYNGGNGRNIFVGDYYDHYYSGYGGSFDCHITYTEMKIRRTS